MHPVDREVWLAIDDGRRRVDWQAWFGRREGADYLTAAGHDVSERAAADLTAFFGADWLSRAMKVGSRQRVGGLGATSPVLIGTPTRRAECFIECLRWWASLQLLVSRDVAGIATIRRTSRTDVSTDRFRHTLAQARLAAVAISIGAQVELEPAKQAGPGDVLIRVGNCELFFEVVSFGPVPDDDDLAYGRHLEHLMAGEDELHWEGDVPGFLNRADELEWQERIAEAAAACRESRAVVELSGIWGTLRAHPGAAEKGRTLHGPEIVADLGTRLARAMDKKAVQTKDAGIAWIWIEDYGALDLRTPFIAMPLQDKLTALGALADHVIVDRLHVGGIIWTRTLRASSASDATAADSTGFAVHRVLPGDVVRETVTVYGRLLLPDQSRIVASLVNAERHWLDWALGQLGCPPTAELLA